MTYEEGMAAAQVLLEERHGAALRTAQAHEDAAVEASKQAIRDVTGNR